MPYKIPFIKPQFPIPEELVEDLKHIYTNNYYSNNGPIYFEFKKALEAYLGQNTKIVAVANATLGLMLAIKTSFEQPDSTKKYVAIPSFTFAAGPLAIKWCGFEPLFFDIDPNTTQPSIESFQTMLNNHSAKLAGIVLTNSFGIGNDEIEQWAQLLKSENLPFIVDSAPGFGATYPDGNFTGGKGECEIFSFHATKPFGIGEGGLITTKNTALIDTLESLKNFGFDSNKETIGLGMNAKITELDCAIGLRILSDYPERLKDRRNTYKQYESNLKSFDVAFIPRAETAAIQFASIMVAPERRPKILEDLKREGVEARTYYSPAVHTFPFFADSPRVDLPHTAEVSEKIISLPVHSQMESSIIDHICDIIIKGL